MKQRFLMVVLVAVVASLCVPPVFAQATAAVKGVCKDVQGNPIAGAIVEWYGAETGRKYDIKTNSKGEYFSLGIAPGKYKVILLKDGQQLYNFTNVPVLLQDDANLLDFDLKKEQAKQAQGAGISPEELKRRQEAAEKAAKETNTVKALNEKLAAANQASQAGDFDTAIATLTEATQMDSTRDLVWFKLADAYRGSAVKQTDPAEKSKRLDQAIPDYQKAIELKEGQPPEAKKDPRYAGELAAYYNNMAEAYAKTGKTDEAVKAYTQATQIDPPHAAQYYYNEGATMTNANVANDSKMRQAAVAAFDKAIAADPNKADAYYWKGSNLIGLAVLKGDKMVAPDGTAEAFQKYLELQPTGPHAEEAKAMLASIGATIETQYGKKKSKK
jgi:tetratricopeptide (TPR) repeat protein